MSFERNVFINCPFDEGFYDLLRPLLFTVVSVGLIPRLALESLDSGEARMEKIARLIDESRFAIHDLSKIAAEAKGDLFRLNMPFELGVDLGARLFGGPRLRTKRCLVLETHPYRYKAALSDYSGFDIASHGDEPAKIVVVVRNWLKNVCEAEAGGPTGIWHDFNFFMADLHEHLLERGFSEADSRALPIPELLEHMQTWVEASS